jgi:hypothetical protein
MPDRTRIVSNVLGLIGAAAGGTLGFFLFGWAVKQGFYAMIVPGALLGLGCAVLARHPSRIRGAVCGVAGLLLGFYTEWSFFPFDADDRLSYFSTHVHQLTPLSLLMIGLGGLSAYWFGKDAGYRPTFGGRKPTPAQKA